MIYYFKHKDGSLTMCGERNQKVLSANADWTEITEEEYNNITNPPKTEEQLEAEKVTALRAKREPLLKAFDIYKTNVFYGIVTETDEEHSANITWYQLILDLNEDALDNVPEKIASYL